LANLCLGVFFNLSIWYKLTGHTRFGAYLAIFGALITLGLNIWWIPIFGYMGAAWATLVCYAAMMVASYFIGQKYYPIDYHLIRILSYLGLAIGLYFISIYIQDIPFINDLKINIYKFSISIVNNFLLLIFILFAWLNEKPKTLLKV
jgi:O-antigen/teichoic acid export membrane protein